MSSIWYEVYHPKRDRDDTIAQQFSEKLDWLFSHTSRLGSTGFQRKHTAFQRLLGCIVKQSVDMYLGDYSKTDKSLHKIRPTFCFPDKSILILCKQRQQDKNYYFTSQNVAIKEGDTYDPYAV